MDPFMKQINPLTTQHGQGQGQPPGPQQPIGPQPPPGMDALNRSLHQQAADIQAPPPPTLVHIDTVNATDDVAVGESIAKQQRLAAMRFNGRP